MYNYVSNFWPAQDLQAVCLTQNVASAGLLLLNGTYSSVTSSTVSFLNSGFIRQVSLTSTNNLSAAVFTITGVQNSTVVTTIINGPNNNTVYTPDYFDIISSVSVSAPVNGISIGMGLNGFFPLYTIAIPGATTFAISSTFSPYAFSFNTQSVNGVTYSLYQSLSNLINNGQTYDSLINNSSLIMKGSPYVNVTQILQSSDISYSVLLAITSANNLSTLQTQLLQL